MLKGTKKICTAIIALGVMLSNNVAYASTVKGNTESYKQTIGQRAPKDSYCVAYTITKVYAKSPVTGKYVFVDSYTEDEVYEEIIGYPEFRRSVVYSRVNYMGNYRYEITRIELVRI